MTTLLIAFDGSPAAETAVRVAGALFPGATAAIATVPQDVAAVRDAAAAARTALSDDVIAGGVAGIERAAADEAGATLAAGERLARDVGLAAVGVTADASNAAWRSLVHVAGERRADVVVCGTRGQRTLTRAALGSTSSGLLHHAGRPVLVVPAEAGAVNAPLTIGYDGSEDAQRAIERVAELLPGHEAVVTMAWESPIRHSLSGRALEAIPSEQIREFTHDLDEFFRASTETVADEGAEHARAAGLAARAEVFEAEGPAWRALLDAARAHGAAAIVCGRRGRGPAASALLGSVAAGLVHNADRPVLVIGGED